MAAPLTPLDFKVAWICALPIEHVAACEALDEEYPNDEVFENDINSYTLGRVGAHNVVIAILPTKEYGTTSAAIVGTHLIRSFPNVRVCLMVGIGGGAPTAENDVRLGDVVVSGDVLQYDFGRAVQTKDFETTALLAQPRPALRNAVADLRSYHDRRGNTLRASVERTLDKNPHLRREGFGPPDQAVDCLYKSSFLHSAGRDCTRTCAPNQANTVQRPARTGNGVGPQIHYGIVASGNQLMKCATVRDQMAREKGILCFEMEAAGLMKILGALAVRGICDYSDSHKNDVWQRYAAMTAAAYARELLLRLSPAEI